VNGKGFTAVLKPAEKQGGAQQLAAKKPPLVSLKTESRSIVQAMGVGMCSILGIACS
jgi:hypothetical protein